MRSTLKSLFQFQPSFAALIALLGLSLSLSLCLLTWTQAQAQSSYGFSTLGPTTSLHGPSTESSFNGSFAERYFVSADPNATLVRNEISLSYSLSASWSASVIGAYTQPTSTAQASLADFDDTEFDLTYNFIPLRLRKRWTGTLSLIAIVPSSRYATEVTETGGAGAELTVLNTSSWLKTKLRSRFTQYFYKNNFADDSSTPPPQTINGNTVDSDLFGEVTPGSQPAAVANISTFQEHAINFIVSVYGDFKVRHQNLLQISDMYDAKTNYSFHDQPGVGYQWSKEFATWYIADANKMLNSSGSVYDAKNIVHQLSMYFSF